MNHGYGGWAPARRPAAGAGATARCRHCGACLAAVSPGVRAIQCAQCNGVTRVGGGRRRRQGFPAAPPPPLPVVDARFPRARGKKRAVLVGIKYTGRRASELRGPINDVKCMRYLLCERFGFPNDCVLILTDEEKDPCRLPTKENIRGAMQWLVQGCSYGDSLVFHFSGMGAQVPDDDGDEVDGFDEAICPMDSFLQGPILDDEINEAIVRPLVPGVKLHAIIDAPHSATVLDLPFLCAASRRTGFWQWEDHRPPSGDHKGTSGGRAMLISGCSDGKSRLSVLPEAYASVGAMTHSFIRAVECEPRATYGRLLDSMKIIIRDSGGNCNLQGPIGAPIRKVTNFSGVQEPQMSSSDMFDIYREPFTM